MFLMVFLPHLPYRKPPDRQIRGLSVSDGRVVGELICAYFNALCLFKMGSETDMMYENDWIRLTNPIAVKENRRVFT